MQTRLVFRYRGLALVLSVAIVGVDFRVAAGRTHRAFGRDLPQSHTMRLRFAKAEHVARQMSAVLPAGAELKFDAMENSITLLGSPLAVVTLVEQAESLDEMSEPRGGRLAVGMHLKGKKAREALARAIGAARDANRRENARPR